MDGHLRLDLEAARKHGVGFDEREAERAVSGHDVGDVRAEQVVDGAAHETVAEIVERALILLEVCGGEAVADHHVVAFEHLGDHVGRGVGGIVSSPSAITYTSASMFSNMERMTLPLP